MRSRALITTVALSMFTAFAATSLRAPAAWAQTPEAKAQAQKKAREGQRLADSGQHEQALALFKDAYAINQEPGYLYNIGIEYQALGRDVDAYNTFDRFLRDVQKIPPEFIADANQQQRELRKRIAEVEIRCTQEGARILVDDRETARTPLYELLRVSAGTHRVTIQKDGFEPFQQTITATGGNKMRIEALMRPIPVAGTPALAAATTGSFEPAPAATGASPHLRDTREPSAPEPSAGDRSRPPLYLSASGGVGFWMAGVPHNPQPSAAATIGAGYRVAELSPRVEFRVGAKLGFSFLAEQPTGTDLFFSGLVNPSLMFEIVPNRLFTYAEVGAGVLVLSGVTPTSVLLSGQARNVSGALSTFELRPGIGVAYAVSRTLFVFLAPSLAWSPRPDPMFAEKSFMRMEIAAGAMVHL